MLFTHTAYIGIDTSGRSGFTYAAIDQDLGLLALTEGELDEVMAFLGSFAKVLVAINAPSGPNKGLVRRKEVRQNLPPLHFAGRGLEMRLAEHALRERSIPVATTPARAESCPAWVQVGFELYRKLRTNGYKSFPSEEGSHQWIETHPQAAFTVLLGQVVLPRATLEGRLQRQLLLHERGLKIRDPMGFFEEITRHRLLNGILPVEQIYSSEQLDALVAAFTAYVAAVHPEEFTLVGDVSEGQIGLPVPALKATY